MAARWEVDAKTGQPVFVEDQADGVEIDSIYEAKSDCTFNGPGGEPVYLRGRSGRVLSSLVWKGHPVLKEHGEMFRPLTLPIDYG
jgi:hypothetical protein